MDRAACPWLIKKFVVPLGKKIYAGNLIYGVSNSDLQQRFEEFGTVQSAQLFNGVNTTAHHSTATGGRRRGGHRSW